MTLDALIEGIRSGKITIDMMGHESHRLNALTEQILQKANSVRDFYQEQLEKPIPETCPTYHDHCRREIEKLDSDDFAQQDLPLDLVSFFEWRCNTCGERLYLHWRDANTLVLGRFDCATAAEAETCALAAGRLPMTHNIQVPTGKLLFANYFLEFKDCDDEDEYTDPWSLDQFAGRLRIMGYLAEQNVGYGQYGNMSVCIYVSPDRKRVVVLEHELECLDEYYAEPPTDNPAYNEAKGLISAGYKYLGQISLSVWRIMFADQSILKAANWQEIEALDYVEADVLPGTWNVTHNFRSDASETTIVGTELELVE